MDDNSALFSTRIFHKNVIDHKITTQPTTDIQKVPQPVAMADRVITTSLQRAAIADKMRTSAGQAHNLLPLLSQEPNFEDTLASSSIQDVSDTWSENRDTCDPELPLLPKEPKNKTGKKPSAPHTGSPPVYPTQCELYAKVPQRKDFTYKAQASFYNALFMVVKYEWLEPLFTNKTDMKHALSEINPEYAAIIRYVPRLTKVDFVSLLEP